jgi:hypothetical protein
MKAKVVVSAEGAESVEEEEKFPAAIERARNRRAPKARHAKAGTPSPRRDETRPPYWTWFIANPRGQAET